MKTLMNRTALAYLAAVLGFAVLLSHPDVVATDLSPQRLACASPAPASNLPEATAARAH